MITKWQRTTREVFGDEVDNYINCLDLVCQKEFGVSLIETVTIDSENSELTEELFWALDKKEYTKELNSEDCWGLYVFNYDGHKMIGSDWDGIVWLISKEPVNIVVS